MDYIGNQFHFMFRLLGLLLIHSFILVSCGSVKKPSLSGEAPVAVIDFIESFPLTKPLVSIDEEYLNEKENDSLLISQKVFAQFVPDSVLSKALGKNAKPKIYIDKRVDEKDGKYLFIKTVHSNKRSSIVLYFDKENQFKAYLPLLIPDANPATSQVSGLDRQYSFYKTTVLNNSNGTAAEGKEVFSYDKEENKFILIMTDALDEKIKEVINPIDTLSRKNKYAADYVKDKMNLVSVRDDKNPNRINFFIHFAQQNGDCTGELKGVANFTNSNTAVYKQPGDACSIQFTFTSSTVTLKELEPCGAHRGVKCSFDGKFPRKKEEGKKNDAKKTSK